MAVYITGDTHSGADIAKISQWKLGRTLSRSDYLIVAGDFGYPWDFFDAMEEDEITMLERGPFTTLFIDGNHENYEYWASRPVEEWHGGFVQRLRSHSPIRHLMRGEIYDIGGHTIFTMGGADSVDKYMRTEGIDWWPVELPDETNFANARKNLAAHDWKVDYVITHTCSDRMLPYALDWQAPNEDRLTHFLDELEDKLEFEHWYFGHMHDDRDCDSKHTLLYNKIVELGKGVSN